MPGSLSTYWKKRDFGVTAEPKGRVTRAGQALSFVIQKHAARRLHYDFRLELDGTLKSWAVPKGPSLDPAVKRMAVHVEDHPLDYAGFEGTIPAGQYGAGTVIVWDRGEWEPVGDPREGYRKGRLKFDLHGEKLQGRWNLVRMNSRKQERQEPWLLIKENDDEARPAAEYDVVEALPDSVAAKKRATKSKKSKKQSPDLPAGAERADLPLFFTPQLATLVDEPPQGGEWIYEVKFDGYRVLARIDGEDVKLFTRNGNDWTARLRPLAAVFRTLGVKDAWIDGEIAVLDGKGHPDFQLLQRAFDVSHTQPIVFFAFDLPYCGGYDLRRVPLVDRRALLRAILAGNKSERLRFSEHFEGDARELLAAACAQGLEGLIGKRARSPYTSTRSNAWIKLKCARRQEFIILGFTDPKGSRTGFGSLLLGVRDERGTLQYAGNVGTGFDEKGLRSIKAKLDALATEEPPLRPVPRGVKGHWIKPKLVAEVAFTEWTSDGRIRHPVFHGLRTDKDAASITREKAQEPPKDDRSRAPSKARTQVGGVAVSHGERVIDESTRLTKLDVVRYYELVAERMLPHLAGRPATLVRAPSGVDGPHFFQKHADKRQIPGIREMDRALWPKHDPMIEVATAQALIGAAQMNVIEFHTSNATEKAIDKPDRVVFDLDPGEGIAWPQVVEAAMLTKKMLDLLELEAFLKTSGGKGLHIFVPLKPKWGWDEVKEFSQDVVVHLASTIPQLFVAKSGPANRIGRIFIDYLRNSFQASTVAAYSARARHGMGVSMPITWAELEKVTGAAQWTVANARERLDALKQDPWKGYTAAKQSLPKAAARLKKAKE